MAWSDAARRAAVEARRLRRVMRYQPKHSQKQTQKDYLQAKLSGRFARMKHYSRNVLNAHRGKLSMKQIKQIYGSGTGWPTTGD